MLQRLCGSGLSVALIGLLLTIGQLGLLCHEDPAATLSRALICGVFTAVTSAVFLTTLQHEVTLCTKLGFVFYTVGYAAFVVLYALLADGGLTPWKASSEQSLYLGGSVLFLCGSMAFAQCSPVGSPAWSAAGCFVIGSLLFMWDALEPNSGEYTSRLVVGSGDSCFLLGRLLLVLAEYRVSSQKPQGITRALISAAGQPSQMESRHGHKALIEIDGSPLLGHVVRQLHCGGVEELTIVLSRSGARIKRELSELCSVLTPRLKLTFVELGEKWDGFHAKSLSHAKDKFMGRQFLLATDSHIFDTHLVEQMRMQQLGADVGIDAAVLVETDVTAMVGLPETAVGVTLSPEGNTITSLSRRHGAAIASGLPSDDRPPYALEAGLFACTDVLFEKLEELDQQGDYYSLHMAMQAMASAGALSAQLTSGSHWAAVETIEELQVAQNGADAIPSSPTLAPAVFTLDGLLTDRAKVVAAAAQELGSSKPGKGTAAKIKMMSRRDSSDSLNSLLISGYHRVPIVEMPLGSMDWEELASSKSPGVSCLEEPMLSRM